MKLRKVIAVTVTVASALALTACGGTSNAPSGASSEGLSAVKSIDYWYWADDATDPTIINLAADFKQQTGITVNLQNIPNPQFYDKLVNAVAAGNGPDATHLNTTMFGQLISADVLAPLDDDIAKWAGKDDVIPSMWNYVKSADGKTSYALPNKQLMFLLYYRKDLFKAAGVDVPKTQQEFVDVAAKLTDPAHNHYAFDIRGGNNGGDQWAAFLVAGGAKFLDAKGSVVFDSNEARAANAKYVSVFPYTPPGSIGNGVGQIKDNLASGTAAMIISHIGVSKELVSKAGDNVGVALIPSVSGDPSKTTYLGTMNMNAVLASSKKKDAAFKWISFLTETKAQLAITNSTNGYLPVVKSVATDPQYKDNQFFQVSVQEQGSSIAWPPIPGTTVASQKTWGPVMQAALLGQNPPDQVVKAIADTLKTGR